jgi:hypothetical protein
VSTSFSIALSTFYDNRAKKKKSKVACPTQLKLKKKTTTRRMERKEVPRRRYVLSWFFASCRELNYRYRVNQV